MRPTLLACVAAVSLAFAGPALAMGGGSTSTTDSAKPADSNYARAKTMIEAKDYKGAIPLLQQVVAKDAKNADAYNLLGYATRKSGDARGSLQFYQQALAVDAKHLGAHEYIGEAYLMLDQPAEAEKHLARLDSLCVFGCTEHRALKTAIANYKAGRKPTN
jgi:tetratricopeptide (TPR) repeat protein